VILDTWRKIYRIIYCHSWHKLRRNF